MSDRDAARTRVEDRSPGARPDRPAPHTGAPVLVVDDSDLFVSFAAWASPRLRTASTSTVAEVEAADPARLAVPDVDAHPSATWWIDDDATTSGLEAVVRALLDMGGFWALVGRVLLWPLVHQVARLGYRLVVRVRRLLLAPPLDESSELVDGRAPRQGGLGGDASVWRRAVAFVSLRRSVGATPAIDTLPTVLLVFALALVSRFVRKLGEADEAAFEQTSVLFGLLSDPSPAILVLAVAAGCFLFRWRLGWEQLADGRRVRWVVMAVATSLAVTGALYSPNYFFAQDHLIDRAIVLGLLVLIWFRPVAVLPFATFVVVAGTQFDYPAGGFTWTHKYILVNVLLLFGILTVLGGGKTLRSIRSFFAGACILFICFYLPAGLTKLTLGWPWREDLGNLTAATHASGWLPGSLGDSIVAAMTSINVLLVAGTLLLEIGSLLLLAGRRIALLVLPALMSLHIVIFVTTGINFVTSWVVVLGALFLYVLLGGAGFGRARPWLVVATLVFAFNAPWFFNSYRLAWLDTSYSVTYQLEAVGESGTRYRVDMGSMAPYDFSFVHNYFSFLSDVPTLSVDSWGGTIDTEVADAVRGARSPEDLAAIDERFAQSFYDDELAGRFDELVQARFREPMDSVPNGVINEIWIGEPPIVEGSGANEVYDGQEPIERVDVRLIRFWWDGETLHPLANCVVREISVAGDETVSPDTTACRLASTTP